MVDFNRKILDYGPELSDKFMAVYYLSLCRQTNNVEDSNQCKALLDGKLRAGYSVYSKYMIGVDNSRVK